MPDTATSLPPDLLARRDRLVEILRGLGRVAVAFSGGIDSTVVAQAAHLALGDRAVAVTADSPSVPRSEVAEAVKLGFVFIGPVGKGSHCGIVSPERERDAVDGDEAGE